MKQAMIRLAGPMLALTFICMTFIWGMYLPTTNAQVVKALPISATVSVTCLSDGSAKVDITPKK